MEKGEGDSFFRLLGKPLPQYPAPLYFGVGVLGWGFWLNSVFHLPPPSSPLFNLLYYYSISYIFNYSNINNYIIYKNIIKVMYKEWGGR